MSGTTIRSTAPHKSVIARLDSSPVRRRVMQPTPLVYAMAARQTSQEDEEQRSITSTTITTASTATTANYRPTPGVRSPTKSYHSSTHSSAKSSPESDRNKHEIKRQLSTEYKKLMTDNNSNSSGGDGGRGRHRSPSARNAVNGNRRGNTTNSGTNSTRHKSSDRNSNTESMNQMNGEIKVVSDMSSMTSTSSTVTTTQPKQLMAAEEKQCNRFGFFIDSNKTEVLPELKRQEIHLIRKREKKWIQMLDKWDKYINNRWKTVRDRCRKGIPHSMRGQAWLYLCGAHHQIRLHPNAYRDLIAQEGNEQIVDEIRKDIHRQFPNHELFAQPLGTGQTDLLNVLKAFSILKPDIGYCQGQAPIASVLLMHMPAEQAFWSLVAICDHYLPGYFSPGLEAIQLHGDMLFSFLKRFTPNAHKLMEKQKIEPILFMTEWFMCVFARTLPWTSVLRVWDMFLCEGIKIVFKCAIVLVSTTLRNDTKKTCPSMYETLEKLRNLSVYHMSEPVLVDSILKCEIHDSDLQREHNIHEKKRRQKSQQKANQTKSNGNRR